MSRSSGIRRGYHTVNSYLVAEAVDSLIVFLCEVFQGYERSQRELRPDGTIEHAEVQIGDSVVMLSAATPEHPSRPSVNFAYVPDVDALFRRAQGAGATNLREPSDWPWGDRIAGFHDPADNRWWVATCVRSDD